MGHEHPPLLTMKNIEKSCIEFINTIDFGSFSIDGVQSRPKSIGLGNEDLIKSNEQICDEFWEDSIFSIFSGQQKKEPKAEPI